MSIGNLAAYPAPLPIPMKLSVIETAEILGVSTQTVYRAIDEGQLPASKFGRKLIIGGPGVAAVLEAAGIPTTVVA